MITQSDLAYELEMLASAEEDLQAARVDENETFNAHVKASARLDEQLAKVRAILSRVAEIRRGI